MYCDHALERQKQRVNISDGDIKNAIATGWHQKKKDEWKDEFREWNYAIRGTSLDGDHLRVCLALKEFDADFVVIITAINLDEEDGR